MQPETTAKHILITGATTGIGLETALQLARVGHSLTITARDSAKGDAAVAAIKHNTPSAQVSVVLLELSSFDSIKAAIEQFTAATPIDVAILNGGLMFPEKSTSAEGLETTFMVNYLSHYLIAHALIRSKPQDHNLHFVCLSSTLVKFCAWPAWGLPRREVDWPSAFAPEVNGTSGMKEYALSKYALTVLATELSLHEGVTAVAVDPGNSVTSMTKNMGPKLRKLLSVFKFTLIPTSEAAEHVSNAALNPLPAGKYYQKEAIKSLPKRTAEEKTVSALRYLTVRQLEIAGVSTE